MSNQGEQVLQQALSLPPEERLAVAEHLLSSLETTDQQRIRLLWAAEAEDRLDAFEKGEIPTISAQELLRDAGKPRG